MSIADKKMRAIVAIEEVESGRATLLSQTHSATTYASTTYPQLCVITEFPFAQMRSYLKRTPAKERDLLFRAIANILLNQAGIGVETWLIESKLGLYLVQERVKPITDDTGIDFHLLRHGISAAGILARHPVLNKNTVGYGYEEINGTMTVVGQNTVTIDLDFEPAFVAAEFSDWQDVEFASCNPAQEAVNCSKVFNGTNWTITINWNTQIERTIRWMAFKETTNLQIFDTMQFVPFKTAAPLDLAVLTQYIDRQSDLEDSVLRDENLWIQDGYLALMDIIISRRWASYFVDGHFDTMMTDISSGDSFFQYYYNFTLLYWMRDKAQNDPNLKRFSITNGTP